MVVLFGICESCSNAIKLDEKKRLFLSLQTVGYDAGDPEPGQGRAAAVCSPAERSLDAVEGQYAESWLLVRHFAPTAMMAGGGFLPTDISCSIKLLEHQTIKKRGATQRDTGESVSKLRSASSLAIFPSASAIFWRTESVTV